ncbi:hypothetical protein Q9314_19475 (plasmid) [Shinella sumterensis]|nr:hypothetical protein Q9314_19475 [Shinella sumterensis]
MTKPNANRTVAPTPQVEDPHPGSISDGTHPAAMEHKQPKPDKGRREAERVSGSADKRPLEPGRKAVNAEAPRHPNKGAYGS